MDISHFSTASILASYITQALVYNETLDIIIFFLLFIYLFIYLFFFFATNEQDGRLKFTRLPT